MPLSVKYENMRPHGFLVHGAVPKQAVLWRKLICCKNGQKIVKKTLTRHKNHDIMHTYA
jgi:hypothetical protein